MTLARREESPLGTPADLHKTWQILAGGAAGCAEVLIGIAHNERAPSASRVAASKTVLEMAGFKRPDTVQVLPPEYDAASAPGGVGESPAARIRSRLAALASQAPEDADIVPAVIVQVDEEGYEVVDAEITEET